MRLTIVRRNAGEVEGVGVSYEELISTNNFQRLITSAQAVEKHEREFACQIPVRSR